MKCAFLLPLLMFYCLVLSAQGSLRGTVKDSLSGEPVPDCTVTVLDTRDSSMVSFARTNEKGTFVLNNLALQNYRLLITHVGKSNITRPFMLSVYAPALDLGILFLRNRADMLESVTVAQEIAPVTLKNDTTEFNAGSFKTRPNAMVEDLLKKLPGITVEKNGTIKANGEEVKKVLLDGKEFFGKDPTIASKNLPADVVDKVQVFDKKSDQAEFTGFDDGNKEKTINLTIKADKKNGVFGKAVAGAGDNSRHEGRLNLNQFTGSRQLSAIAMANNTNKQGFSFQDAMNFSGGMSGFGGKGVMISDGAGSGMPIQGFTDNSQAITTTLAGGLNYNDSWNKKTDFSANYFYNKADDDINQKSNTQYLLPDNAYTQAQENKSNRHNENNRINVIGDIRIDSMNSFKVMTSFIQQKSSLNAFKTYHSNVSATDDSLNAGLSQSAAAASGYSWNSNALFRHRFHEKGRTLSANINFALNNGDGTGSLYSENRFFSPLVIDTINQINSQLNRASNYGINIMYTEPLSRKTLLEFGYSFNQRNAVADKKTFDADANGKYVIPNAPLTNEFDSRNTYHRESAGFHTIQKKIDFAGGITLEQASLQNGFKMFGSDSAINQSFLNFLPNASFQYSFNKFRHLEINYNSYSRQPNTSQLQPVADNSDPLNIKTGNPDLQQEFYHMIRINYGAFDPFRHTGFFGYFNYTGIHNKIVNSDAVLDAGVRVSKPVNLHGLYTINTDLNWTMPLRKIKSSLNINTAASFDHNGSLVNGVLNSSNNWHFGQGADLSYSYKQITDLTMGFKIDYFDSRYSLQPDRNDHYLTQNYFLEWNVYFAKGWSVATDLSYLHRTGLSPDYNASPLIWNAGLARQLFKNKKGEIRLQVYDLLRQNIGITRSTDQNYIQDLSYQVLNRYWLISFTYNISRFAGKSMPIPPRANNIQIINH